MGSEVFVFFGRTEYYLLERHECFWHKNKKIIKNVVAYNIQYIILKPKVYNSCVFWVSHLKLIFILFDKSQ